MEQGFPPESLVGPFPVRAVVLHVVMAGLLVSAVAGLFLAGRRAVKREELYGWMLLALITPIAASFVAASQPHHIRHEASRLIAFYVLLVWGVALTGMVLNHIRLRRQKQGSPFWWVCISLFLLGVLITAALPSTPAAREAARRSQCKNNLKVIGLAIHNYADVSADMFPAATAGDPAVSWRVNLLPFMDRPDLHEQYQHNRPWDDEANEPVAREYVDGLACPSSPQQMDETGRRYTAYVMPTGPGTVSPIAGAVPRDSLSDGTENTLLVVEACGLEVVWTEPRDFDVAQQPVHINLKGEGKTDSPGLMSSYHARGAQAVFADGRVRFISQNTDPAVLRALTTTSGGEAIPEL